MKNMSIYNFLSLCTNTNTFYIFVCKKWERRGRDSPARNESGEGEIQGKRRGRDSPARNESDEREIQEKR